MDPKEVTCDGCGVCCLHMAVPPFHDKDTESEFPADVLADLVAVRRTRKLQYAAHGTDYTPCGWLDMVTRTCRHYEYRPLTCREFVPGNPYCLNMRGEAGLGPKQIDAERIRQKESATIER